MTNGNAENNDKGKNDDKGENNTKIDSVDEVEEVCPCTRYVADEIYICCDNCESYWHLCCVGLNGLTMDMVKEIKCWMCPDCYISPKPGPKVKLLNSDISNSSCTTIRTMLKTELNLITPVLRSAVKDAVLSTMEKQHEKVVEAVEKTTDKSMKSYAEVSVNQQKKIIQEVKNVDASKKVVQEVCRKMDNDMMERQRRMNNVMVSGVAESNNTDSMKRRECDMEFLMDKIGMDTNDIELCFRAGVVRSDNDGKPIPRPLIVKMKTVESAEYWHDYGRGYKVSNYWLNADLCKADREARFFARQERRECREQQIISPTNQ